MWFAYHQSNVRGEIRETGDIAEWVFIEAHSTVEANGRAKEIGLDFSEYCRCCGFRWYKATADDAYPTIETAMDETKAVVSYCRVHPIPDGDGDTFMALVRQVLTWERNYVPVDIERTSAIAELRRLVGG